MSLKTPLLFLVYNRPEITKKVFSRIKKSKPEKLYIAADGPKSNEDKLNTDKTRDIFNNIDWNCNLKKLYNNENLGCRKSVKNSIDWFFQNEERGIILEDDCLPNATAFIFFEKLLKKYSNSKKIMHISGVNYLKGSLKIDSSYYYSAIANINGWATWRESWNGYDDIYRDLPTFEKKNMIKNFFSDKITQKFWIEVYRRNYHNEDTSWSWPYLFSIMNRGGMAISPAVNLISNIGYGANSVHTKNSRDRFANMSTFTIKPPFISPKKFELNKRADSLTNRNFYRITLLNYGVKLILKKLKLFYFFKKIKKSFIVKN